MAKRRFRCKTCGRGHELREFGFYINADTGLFFDDCASCMRLDGRRKLSNVVTLNECNKIEKDRTKRRSTPKLKPSQVEYQMARFIEQKPKALLEQRLRKMHTRAREVNAKRFDITNAITIEDVRKAYRDSHGRCHYSGQLMNIGFDKNDPYCMTLNRKDSMDHYHSSNIVLCTLMAATAKSKWRKEIFIDMCTCVYKHNTYKPN